MFCPECWSCDEEPYLRRGWRLAISACCTRHGRELLDRCPSCSEPLQPHRVDMVQRSGLSQNIGVHICCKCAADLRQAKGARASDGLTQLQQQCDAALDQGYTRLAEHAGLHSVLFFQGLRGLLSGLQRAIGADLLALEARGIAFELLEVADRAALMSEAAHALQDWPSRFIEKCKAIKAPFTQFVSRGPRLPFWFSSVCREHLRQDAALLSAQGARSIAHATELSTGRFTLARSRSLFGRDVSPVLGPARTPAAGSAIERLFNFLDHEVAIARGWDRTDLLRDKVLFLAGRIWGMKFAELSCLEQSAIPAPFGMSWYADPYACDAEAVEEADDEEATLRRWLRFYMRDVRQQYPMRTSSSRVFLCRGRAGRMSTSLIGQRFRRALAASGMSRQIKDYSVFRLRSASDVPVLA